MDMVDSSTLFDKYYSLALKRMSSSSYFMYLLLRYRQTEITSCCNRGFKGIIECTVALVHNRVFKWIILRANTLYNVSDNVTAANENIRVYVSAPVCEQSSSLRTHIISTRRVGAGRVSHVCNRIAILKEFVNVNWRLHMQS